LRILEKAFAVFGFSVCNYWKTDLRKTLYAESESHPEWFADGVHPNAEGNRAIADFLHRSIMG
jgi:lysophospholipase L1-like esterase